MFFFGKVIKKHTMHRAP